MALTIPLYYSLTFALATSSIVSSSFSLKQTNNDNTGLTVRLTHKPIKSTTTLNPSATTAAAAPKSLITNMGGYYTMALALGTPPSMIEGVIDTANQLTWTRCQPCTGCFPQNSTVINPRLSRSYKLVAPNTPECKAFGSQPITSKVDCPYAWDSADGTFSKGILAFDTITIGAPPNKLTIQKGVFGCGHNNSLGRQDKSGLELGIVGLAHSPYSLVSLLGTAAATGDKFSYCLEEAGAKKDNSYIQFGSAAKVPGTIVTPLLPRKSSIFYYLHLDSITVVNNGTQKTVSFPSQAANGNIIVNIGTTMTLLPQGIYSKLASEVKNAVQGRRYVPLGNEDLVCYYTNEPNNLADLRLNMGFRNADIMLKHTNVFVPTEENVECLAFGAAEGEAIYGSLAQVNFLVGFDLAANTMAFKDIKNCASAAA